MKTKSTLKSGRPPTAKRSSTTISHKATSSTIRAYHRLNKVLAAAYANSDEALIADLRQRIEDLGGLESYQKASIQGQAGDRGGDSSVVLMEWLREVGITGEGLEQGLSLLEVGALSTTNACSRSTLFTNIQRIDLHSQSPGILQQDFMARPLPASLDEKFNVLSLSLVLNFVPSPIGRGSMLRRTCKFLRTISQQSSDKDEVLPALFLVLPAACTTNSRFLNDELLAQIMASLGYALRQRKQTSKLVYYLWVLRDVPTNQRFAKKEVNPGPGRNNYCVVLEDEAGADG